MNDQIGPCQIIREIGRGGMGVVHLARDTRLDRDVAIKELPELFAQDPTRLERFERDAKALAALSHVDLAGIYGDEERAGSRYLILEYVEGETLADLLDRGPLPLDVALELAVQIAAGVEAAHEAGVVHRDLKPANIKLSPEGKAKVLDFGLARADEPGSTTSNFGLDSATLTAARHSPTIEGTILGTAAYMSPVQARGRRVDKRTDIWSCGLVPYEMSVGTSPFQGETASDSIGAVLHKEIDLKLLPPRTPPLVRHVLVRCLERNRDNRCRDIGDVRIELERAQSEPLPTPATAVRGRSAVVPWLLAAFAALAAVAAFTIPALRSTPAPGELVRFTVGQPPAGALFGFGPALSPDGTTLACIGQDANGTFGIWIRDLDTLEYRLIPTSGAASSGLRMGSPSGSSGTENSGRCPGRAAKRGASARRLLIAGPPGARNSSSLPVRRDRCTRCPWAAARRNR